MQSDKRLSDTSRICNANVPNYHWSAQRKIAKGSSISSNHSSMETVRVIVNRPHHSARLASNCVAVVTCGLSLGLITHTSALAQKAAAADAPGTSLELNKLETTDKGCRAYIVANNPTDEVYQSLKLDLILFQTDAVIGKRFALDLAPLRARKKVVKIFEIDAMACDKIGSFLINDVMECKTDAGAVDNCLQRLTTSTLTNVQLSK